VDVEVYKKEINKERCDVRHNQAVKEKKYTPLRALSAEKKKGGGEEHNPP